MTKLFAERTRYAGGYLCYYHAVSTSPVSVERAGGPYVAAALLCEKVLREADGVISLIRVVDRWEVTGPTDQIPVIQATLVILMKSGTHRGPAQLTVSPFSPDGKHMPQVGFPINFEGDDDRGAGIVAPMGFPAPESGVYWFDIAIDGQPMTRIPIRVVRHRVGPPVNPENPASL